MAIMIFKEFLKTNAFGYVENTPPKRKYNYIEIASGNKLDFNNLDNSSPVDITDISRGLSMICRFSGQVNMFFSVAQHSLLVEALVSQAGGNPTERLQALLHDSTEAFIGDMSTPLKDLLPLYQKMESLLNRKISSDIGIPIHALPGVVHQADKVALAIEARQLLFDGSWAEEVEFKQGIIGVSDTEGNLESMHPSMGEAIFLDKFQYLMDKKNDDD